ncbi:hypothetical protein [Microbaculum marinum]|uniref:Uncharacterized protein n=1 Tax=Microbaculum marinum TaxID=1764581 RepID=A0AAW9RH55_9HYPH
MFPSAEQIGRAVVAASRLTGEDPLNIGDPAAATRTRHYAFQALKDTFPDARREVLARCLGAARSGKGYASNSNLLIRQRSKWFSEVELRQVIEAIAAPKQAQNMPENPREADKPEPEPKAARPSRAPAPARARKPAEGLTSKPSTAKAKTPVQPPEEIRPEPKPKPRWGNSDFAASRSRRRAAPTSKKVDAETRALIDQAIAEGKVTKCPDAHAAGSVDMVWEKLQSRY